MGERSRPVLAGAVAGLLLLVLPDGFAPVVVSVAALAAGWLLPREPVVAALLFFVPAAVVWTVRLLTTDDRPSIGALVLSFALAVAFTAILTHVGAGMALRRGSEADR